MDRWFRGGLKEDTYTLDMLNENGNKDKILAQFKGNDKLHDFLTRYFPPSPRNNPKDPKAGALDRMIDKFTAWADGGWDEFMERFNQIKWPQLSLSKSSDDFLAKSVNFVYR